MTVTGMFRLLVGVGLVAAGVPLVAPLATRLAAAWTADPGVTAGPGALVAPQSGVVPAAGVMPNAGATHHGAATNGAGPSEPFACAEPEASAPDSAGGLQLDRYPPQPPPPLPAAPHELTQAGPAINAAYRSTLRVPPPDLLDAEGPPPAVPWAAREFSPAAAGPAPSASAGVAGDLTVPATYRVRDGDDLGTIAGRFYGHPAAAAAIWAANRDTLPQPDLLPIGVELRLPPPWAVGADRRRVPGAIEPAAYARPVAAGGAAGIEPRSPGPGPWLAPLPEIQPPPAPPTAVPQPAGPAPGASSVRIGTGETLASLAARLYGDPAMGASIFAVNRDRLRSPELVVAGMELRLPRPVTAPRP